MKSLAVAGLLAWAGCGAAAGWDGEPVEPSPLPGCAGAPALLELGRCALDSGEACTGAVGETARFEALPDGGAMELVVGPQASWMFVFAARTMGIDPGVAGDPTAPENPLVEIHLHSPRGDRIGLHRSRAAFVRDPGGAAALVAPSLFVVVDRGDLVEDQLLRALGKVQDRAGLVRCGELQLAGER